MKINIPSDVKFILNRLNENGFKSYIVGGCVRDSVLNKKPHDWDICTSATPEEIKKCFGEFSLILTGIKFGTITVNLNNNLYEITTFRIDGEYTNNRKPSEVKFCSDITDDLSRRDLTINAIAYNPIDGIIDPFNGIKDIENKMIRCVGDPNTRFKEDALRILRTIRFSITLDFDIEEDTYKAMFNNVKLLNNISKERIMSEFTKMLSSKNAYKISKFKMIIGYIFPEIKDMFYLKQNNPYHIYNIWEHSIKTLNECKEFDDIVLKFAALFHDIGKPSCITTDESGINHFFNHSEIGSEIISNALKRMNCNNEMKDKIIELILLHDRTIAPTNASVKKMLNKISIDQFDRLLLLKECDIKAQNPDKMNFRLDEINKIRVIKEEIIKSNNCFKINDLKINGNDLIKLGLKPGKKIGFILNKLLDMVINDEISNNKDQLIIESKRLI